MNRKMENISSEERETTTRQRSQEMQEKPGKMKLQFAQVFLRKRTQFYALRWQHSEKKPTHCGNFCYKNGQDINPFKSQNGNIKKSITV